MAVFFGWILFLVATIWEAHIVAFLPWWATSLPIWPLVVIGLCIEVDPVRLVTGLVFALVWQQLVTPVSVWSYTWIWLGLLVVSTWLLRVWLSHRSVWSALVLVALGRWSWLLLHFLLSRLFEGHGSVWPMEPRAWGAMLAWDVLFVGMGLPLVLAIRRRVSRYLPRFAARDRL